MRTALRPVGRGRILIQVAACVIRPNLVEHGIDEPVLDRDLLRNPRLPVVDLKRCPYRLLRRLSTEILDMQVITVDVGDSALEQLAKPRVRVLADRDQEVGGHDRPD